jgi:hypothetical protein
MCAEASTVLRAVAADFFFNCWCLVIPAGNHIRYEPRCDHYQAQIFRLEASYAFWLRSKRSGINGGMEE